MPKGSYRKWENMMGINRSVIGAAGLSLLAVSSLPAQNFEQVAPQTPPPHEGQITEAPPSAPGEKNQQVVVEKLRGIVFVDQTEKIKSGGAGGLTGIHAEGIPLLQTSEAEKIINPYLGQPLTMGGLDTLSRDLVLYYRGKGRSVVNIVVPEQAVEGGVIQVLVMEGKLAAVKVQGNKWFDSNFLAAQVRAESGDIIEMDRVRADVEWLNNNPFRQVNLFFTPGTDAGSTDIVLETKDRFPVRFYGGYEDTGNSVTGYERWLVGFNWGNAFGLDHQMNFQYMTDSNLDRFQAYAGSYIIPLPWRHTLSFYGSYSNSEAEISPQHLEGYSWQVGSRYNIPLPGTNWLRHSIDIGYDFKRSNNNLAFGGIDVYANATDISEWSLTYKGTAEDPLGKTTLVISGYVSPGGMSGDGDDTAYQQARAGADTEFSYVRFVAQRETKLPKEFTHVLRATGQVADGNLLPSEQLGFGGYDSIRGYTQNIWNADEGWMLTNELRFPPISISALFSNPMGRDWANDKFQFLFFWDYGVASNRYTVPGEHRYTTFNSIGPGFRYTIGQYLSVRFDYGIVLNNLNSNVSSDYEHNLSLGVTLSY